MDTSAVHCLVAQLVEDVEENVNLEEEIKISSGVLSRWARPGLLAGEMDGPRHRLVWVYTRDEEVVMVSESWENYCSMWQLAQPDLGDTPLIEKLLRICPVGRKVVFKEAPPLRGSVISWIFRAFPVELKRKHHNVFTQIKERSEDFQNEALCSKIIDLFLKDFPERKAMGEYLNMWHPPQLNDGVFVAYGFDSTTGDFEKYSVTSDFEVSFASIGPGLVIGKEEVELAKEESEN